MGTRRGDAGADDWEKGCSVQERARRISAEKSVLTQQSSIIAGELRRVGDETASRDAHILALGRRVAVEDRTIEALGGEVERLTCEKRSLEEELAKAVEGKGDREERMSHLHQEMLEAGRGRSDVAARLGGLSEERAELEEEAERLTKQVSIEWVPITERKDGTASLRFVLLTT